MKQMNYLIPILLCGLLCPIYAEEKEVPDDVSKFADEHLEKYVAKQGRRLSSGERSVTDESDAKKGVTLYNVHYRFSHGTFGCTITVSKKKEKLTVAKKPSCYENPMP